LARLVESKAGCVRIIVEVQDLQPGRASCYTVASYVRAVLKLRALRQELAHAVLEVARCKKALASRRQASILLAEAQALFEEAGIAADAQ
jgi:hypothetical protein